MVWKAWRKVRIKLEIKEEEKKAEKWKEQFLDSLDKLIGYDLKRLKWAKKISQAGKDFNKLEEACGNLKEETDHSKEELETLQDLLYELKERFEKDIASAPKEAREEDMFKKILILKSRYESLIKQLLKMRKKEAVRIEFLIKKYLKTQKFTWLMRRTMKKIFTDLQEENKILNELNSYYDYDIKIIQQIKKMLLTESVKQGATIAIAGAVWLTPFFGTLFSFGVYKLIGYANQFTRNYQALHAYIDI